MIDATGVHTTGVNWESVGVIVGMVAVLVTVLLWYFDRREVQRQAEAVELRKEFTSSLDHLSDMLLARLETKDTVARISERLARVEASIQLSTPTSGP